MPLPGWSVPLPPGVRGTLHPCLCHWAHGGSAGMPHAVAQALGVSLAPRRPVFVRVLWVALAARCRCWFPVLGFLEPRTPLPRVRFGPGLGSVFRRCRLPVEGRVWYLVWGGCSLSCVARVFALGGAAPVGSTCGVGVSAVPLPHRYPLPAAVSLSIGAPTPFRAATVRITSAGPARWCGLRTGTVSPPPCGPLPAFLSWVRVHVIR